MASPKIITVYGATGLQGGSVVESLTKDSSGAFKVRGITRNTNSEKSKSLANRGVEMIQANGLVYQQVVDALRGSWGVFANTNSEDPVSRDKRLFSQRGTTLIVKVGTWAAKWPLRNGPRNDHRRRRRGGWRSAFRVQWHGVCFEDHKWSCPKLGLRR